MRDKRLLRIQIIKIRILTNDWISSYFSKYLLWSLFQGKFTYFPTQPRSHPLLQFHDTLGSELELRSLRKREEIFFPAAPDDDGDGRRRRRWWRRFQFRCGSRGNFPLMTSTIIFGILHPPQHPTYYCHTYAAWQYYCLLFGLHKSPPGADFIYMDRPPPRWMQCPSAKVGRGGGDDAYREEMKIKNI